MKLKNASVAPHKNQPGLRPHQELRTVWSDCAAAGETWREYPRPQMVRKNWVNLNGFWDYAIVPKPGGEAEPCTWDGRILVPFSPESALSGVNRQLRPEEYLWYRRKVILPEPPAGQHYLLHFGAVDQSCDVYAGGSLLASHMGGYLPFTADLANMPLQFVLTIRVSDVSDTSYHSRGKQKLAAGGMYYTAQSGIWQTVWAEPVPGVYIDSLQLLPDPEKRCCEIRLFMAGSENYTVSRMISHEEVHLWSPEDPYLYHIFLREGEDCVETYYAMRTWKVDTAEDGFRRFFLNGKPYILTGVLDQGYWCDGLMTAPSDEAMVSDIQTMKSLGFNLLRKHIKLEPARWYYHCDRLGMVVWQDMVCGGSSYQDWLVTYLATVLNIRHISLPDGRPFYALLSRSSEAGREEFLQETEQTIRLLSFHPCVACWVPFNEGWGQFDAVRMARHIKELDQTRLVDHASGWFDRGGGDVVSLHHYFFSLHICPEKRRALALTEYGGCTLKLPGHSWSDDLYGYGKYTTREALTEAWEELMRTEVIPALRQGVSAFVYTQLSDIEEEENGILTYDRREQKIDTDTLIHWNELVRSLLVNTGEQN